jgi:hypothetical protein
MREIAEAAGISRHQLYAYLAIASIPADEFESLLKGEERPTTDSLVRHARSLPKRRDRRVLATRCPHCGRESAP